MYKNGDQIREDKHMEDHLVCEVPVQIYLDNQHKDIGFIEQYCTQYIKVNNTLYSRTQYTIISRPGF